MQEGTSYLLFLYDDGAGKYYICGAFQRRFTFCLCKLSALCCKGTAIVLIDRADEISLFRRGQKTAVYGQDLPSFIPVTLFIVVILNILFISQITLTV